MRDGTLMLFISLLVETLKLMQIIYMHFDSEMVSYSISEDLVFQNFPGGYVPRPDAKCIYRSPSFPSAFFPAGQYFAPTPPPSNPFYLILEETLIDAFMHTYMYVLCIVAYMFNVYVHR